MISGRPEGLAARSDLGEGDGADGLALTIQIVAKEWRPAGAGNDVAVGRC